MRGQAVVGRPVTDCSNVSEVFEQLTAFGGARLRQGYRILKEAILERQVPLAVGIAGPLTVSDQHTTWFIPLAEAGFIAYVTVTDAICYHDGHRALASDEQLIYYVDPDGDDGKYREEGIIRVYDTGFDEQVLFDQDRMTSAILRRPEFGGLMTTTERNYLLGQHYAEAERRAGARPGFLSTCARLGIPVFIGAPADGSLFLNSVKLWWLNQAGLSPEYKFAYDLHADLMEACAYHWWGLHYSGARALAALFLGGGVPKNYTLQPEPTLSQIFGLPDVRGFDYDVQIVSSPVTDGSLSSCPPAEAVSWGKVNRDTFRTQTVSIQADYSMLMPFIVHGLLTDPAYRARPQLRLYEKRAELVQVLNEAVLVNKEALLQTLDWQ